VLSVSYDFGWQTYYVLSADELAQGDAGGLPGSFRQFEGNPYNPDSSKMVRWGEQTFEEMMIGYLDMDVPVGEPVLHGPDFQPRTEKATMATFQALRRIVGSDQVKATGSLRGGPR
jgi:hypothetical protein